MLSFFGKRAAGNGWAIAPSHILTPFPLTNGNAFLGYAMPPRWLPRAATDSEVAAARAASWGGVVPARLPVKKAQGVLWGKKMEYFAGRESLIAALAAIAPLHTTAPGMEHVPGVVSHGHLDRDAWHALLAESKFMLGMGA